MTYEAFVDEVARRAEMSHRDETERTVMLVLGALAGRLRPVDARAVAARLPPALSQVFRSCASAADPADRRWFERQLGSADERAVRAACRLLAETLDEQARAHLRMQPLAELFACGP
jgi:uncharacterized protein (DUF2267 family)